MSFQEFPYIIVNKLFERNINSDKLYEITRDNWFNGRRSVRGADRGGDAPGKTGNYIGFRLITPGSDVSPWRSAGDITAF